MTAAVEILVANVPNVLSVPVQAVVEKGGKFYCWVNEGGPKRKDVVLGVANNSRIEIKDGLKEGEEVLLNPRATVDDANEDEHSEEKVDVTKRFGGDKPANLPPASTAAAGGGDNAAAKGKAGARFDLMSLDKDGDKKVSKAEMEAAPEQMKGFFDRIDSNSDGFIDTKEIAEMRRRMQQMQQSGGPGGPGGGGPGGPGGGGPGGPGGGGPGGGGPGGRPAGGPGGGGPPRAPRAAEAELSPA